MPVICLRLAYDGTDFAGWQVQPNQRTVQVELEAGIARLTGERVQVLSAGRTDSGVHAIGQVASFRTSSAIPAPKWRAALQTELPDDITLLESQVAPEDFHATFSAKRKCYRYVIQTGPTVLPYLRRYTDHYRAPLNVDTMRAAATCLVGKHDFRSFETDWPNKATSVRTIESLRIARGRDWPIWSSQSLLGDETNGCDGGLTSPGEQVIIEITADGFLYNMVRTIVGTLIPVGRGTWPVDALQKILDSQDRRVAGNTAPACGLYMVWVDYGTVLLPNVDEPGG
jgi:tRNA pseudouridine38-40 synthase